MVVSHRGSQKVEIVNTGVLLYVRLKIKVIQLQFLHIRNILSSKFSHGLVYLEYCQDLIFNGRTESSAYAI